MNEDWDFRGVNTKPHIHGIHPYPARMIPQIAQRLLTKFGTNLSSESIVLDPFCGSGTVNVESILSDFNTIGYDLNPLAVLLTRVKTRPIQLSKTMIVELFQRVKSSINSNEAKNVPKFPNINLWFKPYVIEDLSKLKCTILETEDHFLHDFLLICFSLVVRRVANIYHSGDTYVKRMDEKRLSKFFPSVEKSFQEVLFSRTEMMREFWRITKRVKQIPSSIINKADVRDFQEEDNSIDLIISSPPYGEEQNTVDYSRWSKLSRFWLENDQTDFITFEKLPLGSWKGYRSESKQKKMQEAYHLLSQLTDLQHTLSKVSKEKPLLAERAMIFFYDLYLSIKQMYRVLRDSGFCCLVIGNRSIRGNRLDMDKLTCQLGEFSGFTEHAIYHRTIPTKAIPSKNRSGRTISRENIIVLKK